jgi:hypothetical protein
LKAPGFDLKLFDCSFGVLAQVAKNGPWVGPKECFDIVSIVSPAHVFSLRLQVAWTPGQRGILSVEEVGRLLLVPKYSLYENRQTGS